MGRMNENSRPQRGWLESCAVFILWGTNGLDQGRRLPQLRLSDYFLALTGAALFISNQLRKATFDDSPVGVYQKRAVAIVSLYLHAHTFCRTVAV